MRGTRGLLRKHLYHLYLLVPTVEGKRKIRLANLLHRGFGIGSDAPCSHYPHTVAASKVSSHQQMSFGFQMFLCSYYFLQRYDFFRQFICLFEKISYICNVFVKTQHFNCSFLQRITTSKRDMKSKQILVKLCLQRRLPIEDLGLW